MMIVAAAVAVGVRVVLMFKHDSLDSIFLLHCRCFLIRRGEINKKEEKNGKRAKYTYSDIDNTNTWFRYQFYFAMHSYGMYCECTRNEPTKRIYERPRFVACQSAKICCFAYDLFFLYLSWFYCLHVPSSSLLLARRYFRSFFTPQPVGFFRSWLKIHCSFIPKRILSDTNS